MKLKGNYFWFFTLQLVSGIIAYPLMVKFGVFLGIFLSFLPFFAGLITTCVFRLIRPPIPELSGH